MAEVFGGGFAELFRLSLQPRNLIGLKASADTKGGLQAFVAICAEVRCADGVDGSCIKAQNKTNKGGHSRQNCSNLARDGETTRSVAS